MGPTSPKSSTTTTSPTTASGRPGTHLAPLRGLSGAPFGQLFKQLSSAPPSLRPGSRPSLGAEHGQVKRESMRDQEKSPLPSPFPAGALAVFVPAGQTPAAQQTQSVQSVMSMEQLIPEMVRKIAWGGDRQRATARLELGRGALNGACVTVHSDHGSVRVELSGGDPHELDQFRERIERRLRERGIDLEDVRVI